MRVWRRLLVVALVGATGCGVVTFKRGATPETMTADERACQEWKGDDEAFVECMRKRGWFVMDAKAESEEAQVRAAPAAVPSPTPTVAVPAKDIALPAADPVVDGLVRQELAEATPQPTVTATVSPQPPETPADSPVAEVDPLAKVKVRSWWKLGGSPDDLNRAIDACVTKLGPQHRPDPAATEVTAAMHACLKEAGWYSLGGS